MPVTPRSSLWRIYCWLLPILLIVAAISIYNLDKDALFTDEIRSVEHLGGVYGQYTVAQVIDSVARISPQHAPAYFVLLRFWADVAGFSPFVLRFLATLAGLMGVAGFYRLARDLLGRTAGVWAAVLLGSMPMYIFYTHELRMYALVAALIVLDMGWYYRIIQPQVRLTRGRWIAFFLINLLLLYTHYLAVIPIGALSVYHLLFVRKDRRWWLIAVAMIAAGGLFLPWVRIALVGITTNNLYEGVPQTRLDALILIIQQTANYQVVLFAAIALIGLLGFRHQRKASVFIWSQAVLVPVLMVGLLELSAILTIERSGRYILFLYPALLLPVVLGLMQLRRRYRPLRVIWFGLWAVGVLLFAQSEDFSLYTNRATQGFPLIPPLPQITQQLTVSNEVYGEDLLIVPSIHPWMNDMERLGNYYFRLLGLTGFVVNPQAAGLDIRTYETGRTVLADMSAYPVVWLGYDPRQIDPPTVQYFETILKRDYRLCETLADTPELRVTHYGRLPFGCDLIQLDASASRSPFPEEAITLDQVSWQQGADRLQIALSWTTASSVPLEKYSFSLVVFDSAGQVVAHLDQGLRNGKRVWHFATLETEGWPSGAYILKTTVYDWQTLQRLATAPDLPADNGLFTIAEINIGGE